MEALQIKRPEKPPVYLTSQGEFVDNPASGQIAEEIDMAVMAPIRVIHELFMQDRGGDDFMSSTEAVSAITNTLHSSLEKWNQLSEYL